MVISDEDGRTSMILLEQTTLITHSALPPTYSDSGIGTQAHNADFAPAASRPVLRRFHDAKYRCSIENLPRRSDVDVSRRHQSVDGGSVLLQPCPRPGLACPLKFAAHAPAPFNGSPKPTQTSLAGCVLLPGPTPSSIRSAEPRLGIRIIFRKSVSCPYNIPINAANISSIIVLISGDCLPSGFSSLSLIRTRKKSEFLNA